MLEIPHNVAFERMKSFPTDQEVPDEWKAVPAMSEEQARIYRTKAVLLKFEKEYAFLRLRIEGIVPIYSGSTCIGCLGEVLVDGEEVVAELIIDYATPERLEFQNANPSLKLKPVIGPDKLMGNLLYGSDRLQRVEITFEYD
jgi:hypothetical protein